MRHKIKLAALTLYALVTLPVRAQIANVQPSPPGSAPSWSFSVTPYAWLPTISSASEINRPRGGTVSISTSAGFGDYLSDINLAAMVNGEARYDRFSIITDLIYLNASLTTNNTHLSSVNFGPGPLDIPRSQQLGTGTRLNNTIWSLASAYTVLEGDWGNLDVVAGLRMLAVDSNTNYLLTADLFGPNRTFSLSRGGSLNVNKTYFNGIGGVTGRVNIPNSKFYLPFYFDAGGGGIPLTWQAYGGVAYSAASWADVSLGYRYLTFQNSGDTGVQNLTLKGIILATNLHF